MTTNKLTVVIETFTPRELKIIAKAKKNSLASKEKIRSKRNNIQC